MKIGCSAVEWCDWSYSGQEDNKFSAECHSSCLYGCKMLKCKIILRPSAYFQFPWHFPSQSISTALNRMSACHKFTSTNSVSTHLYSRWSKTCMCKVPSLRVQYPWSSQELNSRPSALKPDTLTTRPQKSIKLVVGANKVYGNLRHALRVWPDMIMVVTRM